MTASRHGNLAHALLASVAAGALMLAASGGAGAQTPAAEKPAGTSKKQAADERKQKLAPAVAPGAYAMVTKGPALPSVLPAWQGLYGGVSFGAAQIRAATSVTTRSVTNTITDFAPPVTVQTNITDTLDSGSGRNWGALSDIFLGYSFRLGNNIIAGVQAEGTIAHAQAELAVVEGQSSTTTTTLRTPPGSTSSTSTLSTTTFLNNLSERWAASGLARLGVVVDPRDLLYVIGGYTYGGFEWNGRSFGLNGATVGGGWEHEIAPGWSLKAEYRYTAFEDKDMPRSSSSASNQTAVGLFPSTVNSNNATTATDHVSGIALHALRLGLTHYFGGGERAVAAYAMATKASPLVVMPWEGTYGGVSDGFASIRATTSSVGRNVNVQNTANPNGSAAVTTTITDVLDNGSGRNWGRLSDVYLGYNFRFGGNVIAGVQVEGTIAEAQAQLDSSEAQSQTSTRVAVPAGTTATTLTTTNFNFVDAIAERWAMSALGRLGVLVDPGDLLYIVGGYTYGSFNWNNRTFGLNGATVGAGWEHEIAPMWTLKAEYRYTAFEDKDIARSTSTASNQRSVSATGAVTTTATNSAFTATDHVSGVALHAFRFGISHYFSGEPAVGAYAMVTKAPPPAAAPWTGLYGGVSFGLTSMHTNTNSTSTEVFTDAETIPGIAVTDVETVNSAFNTRGSHAGAIADIFLGYSAMLAPNVIGGVQTEGSIAHARTLGDGPFGQSFTLTDVQTPPGGPAGTTTETGTNTGTTTFTVQQRWMVSALARLGWLIDPRDMVYAIGGWSYGGFTSDSRVFEMNGPTIGAGIEREVAPSWTVRVEYRYVHFLPKDVPLSQTITNNQTSGTLTFTSTDTFNETDRVQVNLHALRFGIAHYFAAR